MSGEKSDKNKKLLSPLEVRRQSTVTETTPKRLSHGAKKQSVRKSELNFFKACTKVVNKLGEDVTPKPLTEHLLRRYGQMGDFGSFHQIASEYLMSQGSFVQSSSMFGHTRSSASHIMAQSGSFFDDIYDQTVDQSVVVHGLDSPSEEAEAYDAAKLAATEVDLKAPVEIILTDTDIIWLVDIAGDIESSESEYADAIRSSNEIYKELLKSIQGNERYIGKGMGTISTPRKTKGVQTSSDTYASKLVEASWSNIYDTNGPFLGKEEAAEKLNEEVAELIEQQVVAKTEEDASAALVVEVAEKPESDRPSVEVSDPQRKTVVEDGGSAVSLTDVQVTSTSPVMGGTDEATILKSDSFGKSLFVMERVINVNTYHKILTSYRGLPSIFDEEEPPVVEVEQSEQAEQEPEEQPENLDLGPSLNRLWSYRCSVTKGHNVSCIGFNKANADLLAVGYCQFEYAKQKQGLICCWSVKNCEFPERIYHTAVGVSAVSFCIKQPCLLAVGLLDGIIAIYNVSTTSKESILDTHYGVPARHIGPVWDLQWILRNQKIRDTEGAENFSNEILMSVSLDGLVKQWEIRQGFECKDMLKLKRLPAKPTSEKKVKKGGTEIVTSKYDGGLCFDFSPFDGDIYLVGTEDGYIHRCSCLYTEQSLDTYAGHTGPVYKVRWSPFDENIFISCSGDWSIRLWHQSRAQAVLTITTSMKSVPDVWWSPRNSTVVAFVNEGAIEIWDLTENTLDPVIVNNSAATQDVKLSCIAFAVNSDCLLVGDSEGQVAIYQLPDVFLTRHDPAAALQNVIRLALQSQYKQ